MPDNPYAIALGAVALMLLAANVAGVFRDDLVATAVPEQRRADPVYGRHTDILPTAIARRADESPLAFAHRLTQGIHAYLIHYTVPTGPTVRFCHNWVLWLLGTAGIGVFKLYEFQRPREILRRGTGLCSQHAWCLHRLLSTHGVASWVAGYDGHVVVHTELEGRAQLLDADYGIILDARDPAGLGDPARLGQAYASLGDRRASLLTRVLSQPYRRFGRARHVTLRTIDGTAAVLKWALPAAMLATAALL
ncbi:MAG: hypothetical protein U1E49_11440 [Hyphomicrobiaceae bacterium]